MASRPSRKRKRLCKNVPRVEIVPSQWSETNPQSPGTLSIPRTKYAPSQAEELCIRCAAIDFDSIFYTQRLLPPGNGLFISSLDTLVTDKNCPLCCLFGDLPIPEFYSRSAGWHLRVFSASSMFGAAPRTSRENSPVALTILPGRMKEIGNPRLARECPERGFILAKLERHTLPETVPVVEGTAVEAGNVNYSQIEAWLNQCSLSHGHVYNDAERPSTPTVPIQCIDCETRAVVDISRTDTYLALSYVWGATKAPVRSPDGILPTVVSQVIEDSIYVTKRLGHRYLWVDQHCVEQKNEEVRGTQIAGMDRVYAGAYATIVAAAGSDANHGLVGVSRPRRGSNRSIHLTELTLTHSLPSLSHALKGTTWIRRGWTYQEAILSRRCIFFTDYQAYFVCPNMTCREAVIVHLPPQLSETSVQDCSDLINAAIFQSEDRVRRGNHARKFANHVTEYSSRSFTHEGDALDAFRGLLSRGEFITFFGIPILFIGGQPDGNIDAAFALGLWWNPSYMDTKWPFRAPLERRSQLPSWSWVGWKGTVEYPDERGSDARNHSEELMKVDVSGTHAQFWIQDTQKNYSTLAEILPTLAGRVIPEVSPILCLETTICRFHFQKDFTLVGRRTFNLCKCHPQSPHEGPAPEPHAIVHFGVVFFEQPEMKRSRYNNMIGKAWDCVLLFESTQGDQCLIIIEWENDVAYRVGNFRLQSLERDILADVPRTTKRILLK